MLWRYAENLLQRCRLESQKELMICSLSLCQGVVQHMPYLSWKEQKSITCICQTGECFWQGSFPMAIVDYEEA